VSSFLLESPLGLLLADVTPRGLRRLDFVERALDIGGGRRSSAPIGLDGQTSASPADLEVARLLADQLQDYFSGARQDFELPLDIDTGSPFQRRVWQAIAAIPYGSTASYGEIAAAAGRPGAFRAAGSACGANPVALVVPCHRVVAAGRRLGGYGGGLETKVWLLRLEGVQCDGMEPGSRVRDAEAISVGV
jgi:O-6-methylguanine DNA methyltransferase